MYNYKTKICCPFKLKKYNFSIQCYHDTQTSK